MAKQKAVVFQRRFDTAINLLTFTDYVTINNLRSEPHRYIEVHSFEFDDTEMLKKMRESLGPDLIARRRKLDEEYDRELAKLEAEWAELNAGSDLTSAAGIISKE